MANIAQLTESVDSLRLAVTQIIVKVEELKALSENIDPQIDAAIVKIDETKAMIESTLSTTP